MNLIKTIRRFFFIRRARRIQREYTSALAYSYIAGTGYVEIKRNRKGKIKSARHVIPNSNP